MYLEVESAHWGHYFYFSYWRRDRHFTWSSQPPEGSSACSAKGLSVIHKVLESGTVPGIEPTTTRCEVKRSCDSANPSRSNHP